MVHFLLGNQYKSVPGVAYIYEFDRNALHKEKSLRPLCGLPVFFSKLLRSNDRDLLVNLSGSELCASHFGEQEDLRKCPDKFPRTHRFSQLLR